MGVAGGWVMMRVIGHRSLRRDPSWKPQRLEEGESQGETDENGGDRREGRSLGGLWWR